MIIVFLCLTYFTYIPYCLLNRTSPEGGVERSRAGGGSSVAGGALRAPKLRSSQTQGPHPAGNRRQWRPRGLGEGAGGPSGPGAAGLHARRGPLPPRLACFRGRSSAGGRDFLEERLLRLLRATRLCLIRVINTFSSSFCNRCNQ